jgi:hypothetical protein
MTALPFLFLLLSILFNTATANLSGQGADRTRSQFKSWYPQYGSIFSNITQTACLSSYQKYLYDEKSNTTIDWATGADEHTLFVQPLINCILVNTSQYVLYQLQTAQIILGLTPTVLAILGASSDETALLAVIGKRPLLAFLLAAASPSVYTSRAFEHRNPREILKDREGRYGVRVRKSRRIIIVIAEYVFAFASLANAATLSWDLGTKAVCSIATEIDFLPATWAALGVVIHGVGVLLFRLRARRADGPEEPFKNPSLHVWFERSWDEIKRFVPNEVGWYHGAKPPPIYVKWYRESKLYITGSWFHSISTVTHIIFGTLVFSGMNFVGPRDATQLLGRYMASIMGCRIVLMYELSLIRECYNAGLKDAADQGDCKECQHFEDCFRCGGKSKKSIEVIISELNNLEKDTLAGEIQESVMNKSSTT